MKFTQRDKDYLEKRARMDPDATIWPLMDQWPLYVGMGNLARFLSIADLLRETAEVPGDVAEIGSWHGANVAWMAKLLQIWEPRSSKVVHCFESFAGLQDGRYTGDQDKLTQLLTLCGLETHVEIHAGNVRETLPELLSADKRLSFSFVYCDADLFDPTITALYALHPHLVKGGRFVFDEWNDPRWQGETLAVREFMHVHGSAYRMRHVPNQNPTCVLEKIK